jgi:hypothetical protein
VDLDAFSDASPDAALEEFEAFADMDAAPAPAAAAPADAAPPVLAELISAGLVSHEMIGDPARLGGEANGLRALCALVAGPVYRIEAYHYAFRAGPGDLDGRLAGLAPGEWTGALEAALAGTLGEDAAWINPTDLLPEAAAALSQPLLLLRAQGAAVTGALETAGAELQAVINARYAADCARITLEHAAGEGPLADRLAAIEARQAEIQAMQEAAATRLAEMTGTLTEALAGIAARLDAQESAQKIALESALESAQARGQAEGVERLAGEIAALSAAVPGPGAFQETLGVTLAEFLARIEQRAEADHRPGHRATHFN